MNPIRSEIGRMVHAGLYASRKERRILAKQIRRAIILPVECEEITWNPGPVDYPEPFDFAGSFEIFALALKRVQQKQRNNLTALSLCVKIRE